MSGVWVFENGVFRLDPGATTMQGRKVLVYTPTNEVITSYDVLESKLTSHGWERCYDKRDQLQFLKISTVHSISLPLDFSRLKPFHIYGIVAQTGNIFQVRDM